MNIPTYINNHEAVVSIYGRWPMFHDGEIMSLLMDRTRILFGDVANATVEIVIHCFEMAEALEENECPRSVSHNLVHFAFDQVEEVVLNQFNHQNALMGLLFHKLADDSNPRFKVTVDSAFGLAGSFVARGGRVVSVKPCTKQGVPS